MAIPSSGQINLAGTIEVEFGGSAPTSISEYYAGGGLVPSGTSGTNGAVPSSGQIAFSNFYGTQKNFEYWRTSFQMISGNVTTDPFEISGLDSSTNVYHVGWLGGTTNGSYLVKADIGGNRLWTRRLTFSTGNSFLIVQGADTNSAGETVAVGAWDSALVKGFVAKWNSSGTLQWRLGVSSTTAVYLDDVVIAPSGNIYVSGTWKHNASIGPGLVVLKLNSSGTLQWQRFVSGDGYTIDRSSISIDSSENVFVTQPASATTSSVGPLGSNWHYILKYNSSGVLQWQKQINAQASNQSFWTGGVYSSMDNLGNLIVTNLKNVYNDTSTYIGSVNKISTSGSLTWTRDITVSGSGSVDPGRPFCYGTDIYFQNYTGSSNNPNIVKLNGSGTTQFQKTVTSYSDTYFNCGPITNGSNIYFQGRLSSDSFRIAGISRADMNLSLSIFSNGTITSISSGVNVIGDAGLTDAAGSLTVATTNLYSESSYTPATYTITQLT